MQKVKSMFDESHTYTLGCVVQATKKTVTCVTTDESRQCPYEHGKQQSISCCYYIVIHMLDLRLM